MDEIAEKVNKLVEDYVHHVQQHIPVKKAILFGSHAKGNYREDSDVDVAIFSGDFIGKNAIDVNSFLLSLARNYKEFCIEPIGFDENELNQNPFVQEILMTGKEIKLR